MKHRFSRRELSPSLQALVPRILAALAAGAFTLGAQPYVIAAPVVTVTTDTDSDVVGSDDGSPATLIVGTEGGGDTPVIGSASSYKRAFGSRYNTTAKDKEITLTGGKAIVRSGKLRTVYGANATLEDGGSVRIEGAALEVAGGTFSADSDTEVRGGSATVYIKSGITLAKAEVAHSTATITGGSFEGVWTTFAGGYAGTQSFSTANVPIELAAHDNRLTVTSGTFKKDAAFYGGYAKGRADDPGLQAKANNNQLTFEADATVGNLFGGYVSAMGGKPDTVAAEANENTLQIAKGTCSQNVMGGGAFSTGKATANGNTVRISGGTYKQPVYGGYAGASGAGSVANACDNTIEITGTPNLSAARLYGGHAMAKTTNITGNALVVKETKGITARSIEGFQKLDFWIPAGMTKDDTMLTVTSSTPTIIRGAAVTAHLRGDETGDTLRLLHTPNAFLATDSATTLTVWKGVSDATTATIALTDDKKALIVTPPKSDPTPPPTPTPTPTPKPDVNQQVLDNRKSVVETMAGSAAFLGAGADLMTGGGMASASVEAAAAPGFALFAAVGGSSLRHETGSHVDMKGMNLSVGFSREVKRGDDRLIFGPIVEYGRGTYDSYVNDAHGDGSVRYIGGGAFVRQEQKDGTFYEGSLRFGRSSMDYSATLAGTPTSYDTDANYIGAHLGVGQHITEQSGSERELYVRYFYTRQNGTDTKLSMGERYDFDAVDSQRLRTGARWMIPQGSGSLIVGASMQYEFGGDSNATVHVGGLSYTTPSPSLKGFSGSLELGWKAPIGKNATADLSVEGWAGKQRGVTFNAGFNWKF